MTEPVKKRKPAPLLGVPMPEPETAPNLPRCQTDPSCPTAVVAQRLIREGGL